MLLAAREAAHARARLAEAQRDGVRRQSPHLRGRARAPATEGGDERRVRREQLDGDAREKGSRAVDGHDAQRERARRHARDALAAGDRDARLEPHARGLRLHRLRDGRLAERVELAEILGLEEHALGLALHARREGVPDVGERAHGGLEIGGRGLEELHARARGLGLRARHPRRDARAPRLGGQIEDARLAPRTLHAGLGSRFGDPGPRHAARRGAPSSAAGAPRSSGARRRTAWSASEGT